MRLAHQTDIVRFSNTHKDSIWRHGLKSVNLVLEINRHSRWSVIEVKLMEHFVVVITTTDQLLAERSCAALEDSAVPVMLEHVEIHENGVQASGYRLMVPAQFAQTAQRLTRATAFAFNGGFAVDREIGVPASLSSGVFSSGVQNSTRSRASSKRTPLAAIDPDRFSGGKFVPGGSLRLSKRLALS